MTIYEPAEDSYLLAEAVRKYAFGRVLDMGTGSGVLAEAAALSKRVTSVAAADVNPEAVAVVRKKGIRAVRSDLFSHVSGRFDTIVFNPPYLPQDEGIVDAALYGGKKGHETIARFLSDVSRHLSQEGIVLLLFSSHTGKEAVEKAIGSHLLAWREISRLTLPMFETLYVYLVRKTALLRELEEKGVSGIQLLAAGKRGVVYTGRWKRKAVVVKARNVHSRAPFAIENEAFWLRKLNASGIGPKLLCSGKEYFVASFVDGTPLEEFIRTSSRKAIVAMVQDVLGQCKVLDDLGVNKEEMTRPWKHIIVQRMKPVMIDFERCRATERAHNVTQFCQFLVTGKMRLLLDAKRIRIHRQELLDAAKEYKKNHDTYAGVHSLIASAGAVPRK